MRQVTAAGHRIQSQIGNSIDPEPFFNRLGHGGFRDRKRGWITFGFVGCFVVVVVVVFAHSHPVP